MAGAGYKLFNTGDVLTAAQVNTYLMEQTVMVFADAAARTTALTGVVSEGMLSYLKDTNAVEVYNGSAWVSSDDPNAIQNTIVDAKGDLISASAADVPARLAVGNDGETLLADSSTATGLRWQGDYAAGKNKIINGDFGIWQRGTSITPASGYGFGPDRFQTYSYGTSTATISQQSFTPGTAPVTGYEAQYFCRVNSTNTSTPLEYRIEDVRTLAGQTATLSFWAKSASGQTLTGNFVQNYGSGGSAQAQIALTMPTITTSWARYSVTFSVPSVSGKTIGTSSYHAIQWLGAINNALDIWGVQLEAGSVATAFQTATGTLAGETALCMRYFRSVGGSQVYETVLSGTSVSTTSSWIVAPFPVQMRTTPTISYSALSDWQNTVPATASQVITGMSISTTESGTQSAFMNFTHSSNGSFGSNKGIVIQANNTTNARITWSAEL